MSLINFIFPKKRPILTEEDNNKLKEIQRKAYMEEAEKLVEEAAKRRARDELGIKQKKESF